MQTKSRHHVVFDRKGSVEISGLTHGDTEMKQIAGSLGIAGFRPVNFMCTIVRADGLDAAAAARVRAKAAVEGWDVKEVDELAALHAAAPAAGPAEAEPHSSTIEALHQHALGPSRREKMVLPLVGAAVLLVLGWIAVLVWDHASHAYRPVPNLAQLDDLAAKQGPPRGGLAGLLNPDDTQFVSVDVSGWQLWSGKLAIVQNQFVRIPDLEEESIEALVKGGGAGSARILLSFDLARSEPPRFHVERIDRAGIATGNRDLAMEIHPLQVADLPGDFRMNPEIRAADEASFGDLTRFAVEGYLEPAGDGWRFRAETDYRIALDGPADAGLRALVAAVALTPDDVRVLDEKKLVRGRPDIAPIKRLTVFLEMQRIHPKAGRGADRVAAETIGEARVVGAKLGKVYMKG